MEAWASIAATSSSSSLEARAKLWRSDEAEVGPRGIVNERGDAYRGRCLRVNGERRYDHVALRTLSAMSNLNISREGLYSFALSLSDS